MKIELINKQTAFQRYMELKDMAFAIAEVDHTLPGNSEAPECKLFVIYAALTTELKEGDVCIFIDGKPAEQLTDITIAPGKFIISRLYARNVNVATIKNNLLFIKYYDGVHEEYSCIEDLGVWRFQKKNISINVPSVSGN